MYRWPQFFITTACVGAISLLFAACGHPDMAAKTNESQMIIVGVTPVTEQPLSQQLTISSELVPFQEIDVYAKEAGYVKQLLVDYGTHVRKGQLMAVLEVPELEAQLQERKAAIAAQSDEVARAQSEIERVKAQVDVAHVRYQRLAQVSKQKPGLVAEEEVDEARGRDLSAESQMEAAQGEYKSAQNRLMVAKAQLTQTQALFDYSRITAPFDGVVTQRFANLGALMQAGTSSNQATPLVKLSQESLYRLVIPVPESYVRYIRMGDPVEVQVPSLGRSFEGKVARFSVDVTSATRTMHTEVDVPNTSSQLVPGLYATAVLTLNQKPHATAVPLEAISREGDQREIWVVDESGRVQRRPVTVGMQTANFAEVLSGVHPGEQVVVSDRSGLKPGQTVKPHIVQKVIYDTSSQDQQ